MFGVNQDQILKSVVQGALGVDPAQEQQDMQDETAEQKSTIERERPDPTAQRTALVSDTCARVREAKTHWTPAFKKMEQNMAVVAGRQWPQILASSVDILADPESERYVANITLRHIQQRTATLYGKNPKAVARQRERLLSSVWDGSPQTLQTAFETAASYAEVGLPPDPMAAEIIADAQQAMRTGQQLKRIGKTLELMFAYELDEQIVPFKTQMKSVVRRCLTTGIAYTKLGYQRVMGRRPEIERSISDMSQQLATLERISADIADGVAPEDSAEAERLKLMLAEISKDKEIVVREGLAVSYPDSRAIIPDKGCKQLRGFVGCEWVAEEFFLTRDQIAEIYKKDVAGLGSETQATPYGLTTKGAYTSSAETHTHTGSGNSPDAVRNQYFCVWEVYNRATGLVYTVCDGYPDFLADPGPPDVYLERFYPWFALALNEVCDDQTVFPISDVELIRDMQFELNRARQGLREHRRAARPKTFVRQGVLSEKDKAELRDCSANAIIELSALQPGETVEQVLQPFAGPGIDPNLYETNSVLEDILRVAGQQEANLGGTSGATATETNIAEGSRMSSAASMVDDLDEFLTEFARAAGQILLKECSVEKVTKVVGPGAIWPDQSREDVAAEIHLEVEAASTGRPNKGVEIQNAKELIPLLMQIPGIQPQWVAKELIRRMDDRLDLADAFAEGMPSIQMLNNARQIMGGGPDAPDAQGPQGANNAQKPSAPRNNAAPTTPNMNDVSPV